MLYNLAASSSVIRQWSSFRTFFYCILVRRHHVWVFLIKSLKEPGARKIFLISLPSTTRNSINNNIFIWRTFFMSCIRWNAGNRANNNVKQRVICISRMKQSGEDDPWKKELVEGAWACCIQYIVAFLWDFHNESGKTKKEYGVAHVIALHFEFHSFSSSVTTNVTQPNFHTKRVNFSLIS